MLSVLEQAAALEPNLRDREGKGGANHHSHSSNTMLVSGRHARLHKTQSSSSTSSGHNGHSGGGHNSHSSGHSLRSKTIHSSSKKRSDRPAKSSIPTSSSSASSSSSSSSSNSSSSASSPSSASSQFGPFGSPFHSHTVPVRPSRPPKFAKPRPPSSRPGAASPRAPLHATPPRSRPPPRPMTPRDSSSSTTPEKSVASRSSTISPTHQLTFHKGQREHKETNASAKAAAIDAHAHKSTKTSGHSTPKSSKTSGHNTPKSTKVSGHSTPKSPKTSGHNTPKSTKMSGHSTPKSTKMSGHNTPKSTKTSGHGAPKSSSSRSRESMSAPSSPTEVSSPRSRKSFWARENPFKSSHKRNKQRRGSGSAATTSSRKTAAANSNSATSAASPKGSSRRRPHHGDRDPLKLKLRDRRLRRSSSMDMGYMRDLITQNVDMSQTVKIPPRITPNVDMSQTVRLPAKKPKAYRQQSTPHTKSAIAANSPASPLHRPPSKVPSHGGDATLPAVSFADTVDVMDDNGGVSNESERRDAKASVSMSASASASASASRSTATSMSMGKPKVPPRPSRRFASPPVTPRASPETRPRHAQASPPDMKALPPLSNDPVDKPPPVDKNSVTWTQIQAKVSPMVSPETRPRHAPSPMIAATVVALPDLPPISSTSQDMVLKSTPKNTTRKSPLQRVPTAITQANTFLSDELLDALRTNDAQTISLQLSLMYASVHSKGAGELDVATGCYELMKETTEILRNRKNIKKQLKKASSKPSGLRSKFGRGKTTREANSSSRGTKQDHHRQDHQQQEERSSSSPAPEGGHHQHHHTASAELFAAASSASAYPTPTPPSSSPPPTSSSLSASASASSSHSRERSRDRDRDRDGTKKQSAFGKKATKASKMAKSFFLSGLLSSRPSVAEVRHLIPQEQVFELPLERVMQMQREKEASAPAKAASDEQAIVPQLSPPPTLSRGPSTLTGHRRVLSLTAAAAAGTAAKKKPASSLRRTKTPTRAMTPKLTPLALPPPPPLASFSKTPLSSPQTLERNKPVADGDDENSTSLLKELSLVMGGHSLPTGSSTDSDESPLRKVASRASTDEVSPPIRPPKKPEGSSLKRESSRSMRAPAPSSAAASTPQTDPSSEDATAGALHPLRHPARHEVPAFFRTAVEHLARADVVRTEGIMRLSPNESKLTVLRQKINYGEPYTLEGEEPALSCGIIKLFIRELPDGLCPFKTYEKLIKLSKQGDKRAEIYDELNRLPVFHHRLFSYFISFLHFVASHVEENLMTPRNLASILGPTVFRPQRQTLETMKENKEHFVQLLEDLICKPDLLHMDSPEKSTKKK